MIIKGGKRAAACLLLLIGAGLAAAAEQDIRADERIPFPRPGSHRSSWLEYHGRSVFTGGGSAGRPDKACLVCHERSDCMICHTTQMPRDHTNFWRTRGHGLQASGNRERCLACHRQDYCIRCHSETAPRTHTASWTSRHCGWCHFSSGTTPAGNCAVCHRQAPHAAAPHPVPAALDCLMCH